MLFVGPEFAAVAEQVREKLPTVQRVIAVHDGYESCPAATDPDPRVHGSAPEGCFVQLDTSGTTGFPKGAMRPRGRGRLPLRHRPDQGHDHLRRGNIYPAEIERVIAEHPKRMERLASTKGVRGLAVRFTPKEAERPYRFLRWLLARLERELRGG